MYHLHVTYASLASKIRPMNQGLNSSDAVKVKSTAPGERGAIPINALPGLYAAKTIYLN